MPLPTMKEQFAALIARPSVSCTQAHLDQSNRPVIDLLASWLGDLGFTCDIQAVSPGKFTAGQFWQRSRWPGAGRAQRHGAVR